MACLASLPLELRTIIVDEAAGPVRTSQWAHRRDTLLRLSLVGPLHQAAQERLARAVRVQSAAQLVVAQAKAASSEVQLDLLCFDNSDEHFTELEPVNRPAVAAFPALRFVSLVWLDDLDLDPLGALPELQELSLNGCTVTVSPGVVFPKLVRLAAYYTTARADHKATFLSASCLPRLLHMRALHHDVGERADDLYPYLRPDDEFFKRLVSLEYNVTSAITRYRALEGAPQSLYVLDVACLPSDFAQAVQAAGEIRHARLDSPSSLSEGLGRDSTQCIVQNLRYFALAVTVGAAYVANLRTVLLPSVLRDLPGLHDLVEAIETSSMQHKHQIKIYFSDDASRDAPLGQPTLFMQLAELGRFDD